MRERTVYVVQRLHWEYNDNWYDYSHSEPLRAYADREYAELMRDEAELQAQIPTDSLIGFVGGFENATSLAPETILAFLRARGAPEPPLAGDTQWNWNDEEWWLAVREQLDDQGWIEFRNHFDRARFFTVVPLTLREEGPA